ncbi:hypothetical protein [Haemophilus haemolyticus]|uniref:hypothetical protein n=1 Tax=Haemophilus haemolyticus TaxID=726 RepID=UPI000E585D6B|nr:hypothetical protein [Haemophilus haemolyticus]
MDACAIRGGEIIFLSNNSQTSKNLKTKSLIFLEHTFSNSYQCHFLILFEINIDNNIKGEPNENNLKQKTIISIISSKEIEPPFITNENIIKPNEKTKKQHEKISIKKIII